MIKAVAYTNTGAILVLGISEENVQRMKACQPIFFDPAQLKIKPGTPFEGVSIFYGETDASLQQQIKALMGKKTEMIVVTHGHEDPR